jgi:hypothetical protein
MAGRAPRKMAWWQVPRLTGCHRLVILVGGRVGAREACVIVSVWLDYVPDWPTLEGLADSRYGQEESAGGNRSNGRCFPRTARLAASAGELSHEPETEGETDMATAASDVIQLHWDMKDGLLTVTPEDEDRFSIKVGRAIELLQQANRAEDFRRQFTLLLRELARWLKDRSDVERAFLTLRDGALVFVVVREFCEYDDAFEDALSELDYSVANDADLDLIKMDAIGLPPASDRALSSFLDPAFTLEYGHRSRPHSTGQ